MTSRIDIEDRLAALAHVYGTHDRFAATLTPACGPGCAHCCTRNVTLTTLEGLYLIRRLETTRRKELVPLLAGLSAAKDFSGFRPTLTTNHIAEYCRRGEEPPEDSPENSPKDSPGEASASPEPGPDRVCPLLRDALCSLYPGRPFGCRCMTSATACTPDGMADMPPVALTESIAVMQVIEHLDAGGFSGNLVDVLTALLDDDIRRAYKSGTLTEAPAHLVANHALTVLMVPPEHREAIQPFLDALRRPAR